MKIKSDQPISSEITPKISLRVQGLADIEDAQRASTAPNGTLVPWPLDPEKVIDMYYGNPWLYAVGAVLADAVSSARVTLVPREYSDEGEQIEEGDLAEYARGMGFLMRSDVGLDGMTTMDIHALLRAMVLHLDGTGNLFIESIRNRSGNELRQLGIMLSQFIRYENLSEGSFSRPKGLYLYQMDQYRGEYWFAQFGTRKATNQPREFLHQRLPNLISSVYGLPAWIASRDSVEVDNAHRTYLRGFFGNHSAPRWLIEITMDPAWITSGGAEPNEDDADNVYAAVQNYLSANRGQMAGRNLILRYPGGIIVKTTALDVKLDDPTFGATAKISRDEILAVRHVSLIDLGLPEGGYRATAETQSENFRAQVLEPFAGPALAMLNQVLHAPAPHGLGIRSWNVALEFLRVDEVLARIESVVKATGGAAVLAPNEGRKVLGYESYDNPAADQIYMPANLIPLEVIEVDEPTDIDPVATTNTEQLDT